MCLYVSICASSFPSRDIHASDAPLRRLMAVAASLPKRVQLSWQDAWKLSTDLATQEALLSAVSSLGFCSHVIKTILLNVHGEIQYEKDSEVVWYRNSL